MHDGAPDVAAVAPHAPHAVEAGQPGAATERLREAGQPHRLAHLGVVVEEAQHVAGGETGPLVERPDESHVVGVALVPQRRARRGGPEVGIRPVGRRVVDHTELELEGRRTHALQAGTGEGELVVDDHDDARVAHRSFAYSATTIAEEGHVLP